MTCLIPIAVCLLLTKSRSGYIATGVGLMLVWLLCREQTIRIARRLVVVGIVMLAVCAGTVLAVGTYDEAVLFRAVKSFSFRTQYWRSSLENHRRSSVGWLRAGQLSRRLHPIQIARRQRGGG